MPAYRHMNRLLPCLLLLATGCALHLRAPDPDLPTSRPLPPSREVSYLAAVARLPLSTLSGLLEREALAPLRFADRAGFIAWSYDVQRAGPVHARAQDGVLCFMVPFHGSGKVSALGGQLERALDAVVDVCARPRLSPSGQLTLQQPAVRVALDRVDFGGPARPLLDTLSAKLESVAGKQIADFVRNLKIPVGDYVTPTTAALYQSVPLTQGACLQLRPLSLRLAQPEVDPNTLRLAFSIATQPTIQAPCGPPTPPQRLPMVVDEDLHHPETTLTLPVAIGLQTVRDEVLAQLLALGQIQLAGNGDPSQGWIQVTGLRLDSAGGALLARAQIRGEVRDSFLFVPYTRQVDGEFLLWGVPQINDRFIELGKVEVDLATDNRLNALGAALQRQHITEILAKKLRIPRAQIEGQARQALATLGQGVTVAGQRMPVRIDTRSLTLDEVHASGQRLEVVVRFVGQVVVGETARQ